MRRRVRFAVAVSQWTLVGDEIVFNKAAGCAGDDRAKYRANKDSCLHNALCQAMMHDTLPLTHNVTPRPC